MLEIRGLQFSYKKGNVFRFPDFNIAKGEQVAVTGNSGSGKTTLLHLVAGILKADSGSVILNGADIQKYNQPEKDRFRGKNIGLIFQKHFFIQSVSMKDNLLLAQNLPGLDVDKVFIDSLMDELEIAHLSIKYPSQLSQGELQRFSLARSLANKPILLLADESTSSLDDLNCERFVSLITATSQKHQTTLLVATHDARLKRHFAKVIQL